MGDRRPAHRANTTIRVVAAVAQRDEKFLICQRPAHKRYGGLWEFPGGKREPGETDADALQRELREELGIELSEIGSEYFATQDPGSPFLIAFVPVAIIGEPLCLEHSAIAWANLTTLLSLPLAPSDRRFIEHFQKHQAAATSAMLPSATSVRSDHNP